MRKKYLCAVQMKWSVEDYRSRRAFEVKIDSIMQRIHSMANLEGGEALIVFPEDVGTPLVFMDAPDRVLQSLTLQEAVKKQITAQLLRVVGYRIKYRVGWFRALALTHAAAMAEVYMETFADAAREYGVHIVAGSILLPDFKPETDVKRIQYHPQDGNVYNISCVFNASGHLIGTQKKAYLVPDLEDAGGFDLCRGSVEELRVIDTPVGRLGIAICLDTFKTDVTEALQRKGADILIQPSANCKRWDCEEQRGWLQGSWRAMKEQRGYRYSVNPMMTGCLFDLCFEGQSAILSNEVFEQTGAGYMDLEPLEHFIKVADTGDQEEILILELPSS